MSEPKAGRVSTKALIESSDAEIEGLHAHTDAELGVVDQLSRTWNEFIALARLEGVDDDDLTEFRHAINRCHMIVGHRLAARVAPEVWRATTPPREATPCSQSTPSPCS